MHRYDFVHSRHWLSLETRKTSCFGQEEHLLIGQHKASCDTVLSPTCGMKKAISALYLFRHHCLDYITGDHVFQSQFNHDFGRRKVVMMIFPHLSALTSPLPSARFDCHWHFGLCQSFFSCIFCSEEDCECWAFCTSLDEESQPPRQCSRDVRDNWCLLLLSGLRACIDKAETGSYRYWIIYFRWSWSRLLCLTPNLFAVNHGWCRFLEALG